MVSPGVSSLEALIFKAVLCGVQRTAWRRVSAEGRDRAPRAYLDRAKDRRRTDE